MSLSKKKLKDRLVSDSILNSSIPRNYSSQKGSLNNKTPIEIAIQEEDLHFYGFPMKTVVINSPT